MYICIVIKKLDIMSKTQFYIAMTFGVLSSVIGIVANVLIYKDYLKLKKETNELNSKSHS